MHIPRSAGRRRLEISLIVLGLGLIAFVACTGGDRLTEAVRESPLAFDKHAVTLQGVSPDSPVAQAFLVVNQGTSVLRVGPPEVISTDCGEVSTQESEFVLLPGGVALLPVHIGGHGDPKGNHRVQLSVPSGVDGTAPTILSIEMKMREADSNSPAGPRLNVDKDLIDIGDIPYDWPMHERFVLSNDGDKPLVFEGIPEIRTEDGC